MARIIKQRSGYRIETITSGPKPNLDTYLDGRDDIDGVLWFDLSLKQNPEGRMAGSEEDAEAMEQAMTEVMGEMAEQAVVDALGNMF